jgi:biotin carboxylase
MRVWFNRTYATTCHLIADLRANPDGRPVHVISTHLDPDSPVLAVSDHAELEPLLAAEEYVDWAIGFAEQHRIDVLVPRYRMAELADARPRFEAAGIALACPSGAAIRLFEDKAAAYVAAAELGVRVPPYAVVRDADGLRSTYETFRRLGGQVCMKPVVGVGGEGYRRLTHHPSTAAEYAGELRSVVRVDAVAAAWERDGGPPAPVLVMPFLDGAEVSVDALATADGTVLAAVGRRHDETRARQLVDDVAVREMAETLIGHHRIGYLSNTQARYWRGPDDETARPYLLEVNTRAAGGLFQTSLSGLNLIWPAVQLALGEAPPLSTPTFGARYAQLDSMVELPPR